MKAAGAAAIVISASSLIWAGGAAAQATPPASARPRTPAGDELGKLPAPPAGPHNGYTRMRCDVRDDGRLENCVILEERPKGYGFGRATLNAAKFFKMRTRTPDGRPAPKTVIIPMRWVLPDKPTDIPAPASTGSAQPPSK
jgi:TonB family protein